MNTTTTTTTAVLTVGTSPRIIITVFQRGDLNSLVHSHHHKLFIYQQVDMRTGKRTWFLPPDFTFTPDGDLRLGTVIAHPKHPTSVLAHPDTESTPITLPSKNTILEKNHTHGRDHSQSTGWNGLANIVSLASASVSVDSSRTQLQHYSNTDHEIFQFATQPTDETIDAILNIPKVSKYVNSGMFGKRPVYIVSGLRVTPSSFTVSTESTSSLGTSTSGSVPIPGVPVEIGGGFSNAAGKKVVDSYNTAPGIIFAFKLHVIRPSRRGGETVVNLFSHRSGFLTGNGSGEREEVEVAEVVTAKELEEDVEEQIAIIPHDVEDDDCCITFT